MNFWLRIGLLLIAVILITDTALASPDTELQAGQVWTIKDAPGDSVRVTIERVEELRSMTAVHVSVTGNPVGIQKDGNSTKIILGIIGHMPFEKSALEGSLDQLVASGATASPFFEQGYEIWKADNGGLYSISVAEALQTIQQNITN